MGLSPSELSEEYHHPERGGKKNRPEKRLNKKNLEGVEIEWGIARRRRRGGERTKSSAKRASITRVIIQYYLGWGGGAGKKKK